MRDYATILSENASVATLYDLLVGAIQPRPIAFVSTLGFDERANLAPFSYFMPGGANPASLAFSISGGAEGRRKDTLVNIEETGEFVVNMLTREMAEGMNRASGFFPKDISEWPVAGFTPVTSQIVKPARVGESPIQMECRLHQVIQHGEGAGCAFYVIGEVVAFHTCATLWDGERIDPERYRPISRMGGDFYLDTAGPELFRLQRP